MALGAVAKYFDDGGAEYYVNADRFYENHAKCLAFIDYEYDGGNEKQN